MKVPKEFDYFKAWLLFFVIATVGGDARPPASGG
jgi:hypothetical protein